MFSSVAELVGSSDYAVANLETVLAGGPNYSGYPTFNSPDALACDLTKAGFDLCLTANNHCLDQGFSGLSRTLDVLDEAGLAHVGTSRTAEDAASDVVLADMGGISVAFLGYTYGMNGFRLPKNAPYAVNVFNTDYLTNMSSLDQARLKTGLDAAKALSPDLIVVMIHWVIEYQTSQNSYQEKVADFLFANGADIVLGGTPPCAPAYGHQDAGGRHGRSGADGQAQQGAGGLPQDLGGGARRRVTAGSRGAGGIVSRGPSGLII